MRTIADQIKAKSEIAANWERENPGRSWCNPLYPENIPKIYVEKELIASGAFRSLSRWAILVYLDLLSKRLMQSAGKRKGKRVWHCVNNGEIQFTYSEAAAKGIGSREFRSAIDELQENGFIDIKHQGRGGRKPASGSGDATLYWIDDRWKDYGTDDFKPPRNPRKKDTRSDRGWHKIWDGFQDEEERQAFIESRKKKL